MPNNLIFVESQGLKSFTQVKFIVRASTARVAITS
jgi:hypothetical protein